MTRDELNACKGALALERYRAVAAVEADRVRAAEAVMRQAAWELADQVGAALADEIAALKSVHGEEWRWMLSPQAREMMCVFELRGPATAIRNGHWPHEEAA